MAGTVCHLLPIFAPGAEERIARGIPTHRVGKNVFHFGAFKGHIGLHRGAWAIEAFARALKRFKTSKGAIQIPLEHEVPLYRVSRLIAFDLPAVPSATKRPGTRRSGGAR